MKMEKVIKDGKVAVLYSPGYGAGWYTWSGPRDQTMLFDPALVNMVLNEAPYSEMEEYAKERWPDEYLGGLGRITVEWLKEGTLFRVEEYDGYESVHTNETYDWIVA